MKTPDKIPPAEVSASSESNLAPSIIPQASQTQSKEGEASGANAPTQSPPEKMESQTGGITAAVWNSDKRVNALYATFHARNSWMSITGIGWKKLPTTFDSACEAMTALAAHCREKACRIDYSEENGEVKEIYVW